MLHRAFVTIEGIQTESAPKSPSPIKGMDISKDAER